MVNFVYSLTPVAVNSSYFYQCGSTTRLIIGWDCVAGIEPVEYEEKMRQSWAWKELKAVRYT